MRMGEEEEEEEEEEPSFSGSVPVDRYDLCATDASNVTHIPTKNHLRNANGHGAKMRWQWPIDVAGQ
eukprot:8496807-Prorocentrum_lima.AAC.1